MFRFRVCITVIVVLLLAQAACSPNPYRATNKMHKQQVKAITKMLRTYPPANSIETAPYWLGTTNFGIRKPNYVVIHHTAQNSCEQTLRTFTMPKTQVSAHYVICKDGTIHQMLNDYLRAHHAGVARWGGNTDLNSSSIGIELDNNGFEDFSPLQMHSLLILLDTLKHRYNIPEANFIGHGDIAPTRKNDPNWRFNWKLLADSGYGKWYVDTTGLVPVYNDTLALKLIGYDVRDSLAAINAFKRHWLQDSTPGMNEAARKVLYGVLLAK